MLLCNNPQRTQNNGELLTSTVIVPKRKLFRVLSAGSARIPPPLLSGDGQAIQVTPPGVVIWGRCVLLLLRPPGLDGMPRVYLPFFLLFIYDLLTVYWGGDLLMGSMRGDWGRLCLTTKCVFVLRRHP